LDLSPPTPSEAEKLAHNIVRNREQGIFTCRLQRNAELEVWTSSKCLDFLGGQQLPLVQRS
jgi:hypothetical protein